MMIELLKGLLYLYKIEISIKMSHNINTITAQLHDYLVRIREGWISVLALQNLLSIRYDQLAQAMAVLEQKGIIEFIEVKSQTKRITLYRLKQS